jgi:hypothetical protein
METHLNVMLVNHTPEPESTTSAAAKLCYALQMLEKSFF